MTKATASVKYDALIKEAYKFFKLPLSVVGENGKTHYCYPDIVKEILPCEIIKYEIDSFKRSGIAKNIPCIKSTPYNSFIGIFKLPDGDYLLAGPAFSRPFSTSMVSSPSKELLSKDEISLLHKATKKSPIVDQTYFAEVMSLLVLFFYYKKISAREILSENAIALNEKISHDAAYSFEADYSSLLLFESGVHLAVQEGNIIELAALWEEFTTSLRHDHEEYLYYEHHLMIPLLSTARYAALSAGAPKEEVISIFHSCISKIAAGESLSVNSRIIEQGTYDLCSLVKKSKRLPFHTDICIMCEHYIDEHISEKITAAQIARHCGIDRSLVFDIFRENYGISLTEYIQNDRIKRAKVLLVHSKYSVSEIAHSLGFGSTSYFSKVFAQKCGCTPKEYKVTGFLQKI